MAAIEVNNVSKQFGDVRAVRDFDLSIDHGEVFGFLGPNGAGKSTTINMFLDFIRPTTGKLTIAGYDPQEDPRAVRRRIGVLPEGHAFYDRLTGRRHVELAVDIYGSDDVPGDVLERVGLTGDEDGAVGGYSKGMRQRLALGMALVGDPEVLVLDEPSSGLDPNGIERLRAIVREEAARGAAVFFSSHALEQVEAVCDRVGIMDDGELLTVETIDGLRDTLNTGSTLVLSVDTVPDEHDLTDLDGVESVESDRGVVRITCADPDVKSAAIGRVEAAGATVSDIDVEESSLAELFTAYTGSREEA